MLSRSLHGKEVNIMQVNLIPIITATAALAGIVFGWLGYRRGANKDNQEEGALKNDTKYIKRRIDDVLLEQRDTNKTLCILSERVTRVEESSKQAHKRIDGIEHRMDGSES